MSDVLSAEDVREMREHWEAQSRKYSRVTEYAREQGVLLLDEQITALARSHEQLRGERDGAFELAARKRDEAQAAARAGGCAADALRELADDMQRAADRWTSIAAEERARGAQANMAGADGLPAYVLSLCRAQSFRGAAEAALTAAVSGQTAEKEKA